MTPPITAAEIPPLGHDEAMRLAAAEYDRLLALADDLRAADWPQPTDCTGWDVRAVLGHLVDASLWRAARLIGGTTGASEPPQERIRTESEPGAGYENP